MVPEIHHFLTRPDGHNQKVAGTLRARSVPTTVKHVRTVRRSDQERLIDEVTAMIGRCLLFLAALTVASSLASAEEKKSARDLLAEFSSKWDESAWVGGRRAYIRPLDDEDWKVRMTTLIKLSKAGSGAKDQLLESVRHGELPERILAAQALGYLGTELSTTQLLDLLREESNPSVRLYLVDVLGMVGKASEASDSLRQWRDQERNGDVRKHIGYALQRGTNRVGPDVLKSLRQFDHGRIAMARIGKPAPDFHLKSVDGKEIQLSQFRGKQAVVLVFIYGDT